MLDGKAAVRRARARAKQTRRLLVMTVPNLCVLRALSPQAQYAVASSTSFDESRLRAESGDTQQFLAADAPEAPRR
jgi:hypothetical protein